MAVFISACSQSVEEVQSSVETQTEVNEETTSKNVETKTEEPSKETETNKPVQKAKEPRVGMAESDIQDTELGKATDIEKCRDYDKLDNNHRWKKYTWDFGGGKVLEATVYYRDGYGKVQSVEKFPKDPYGNTISSYWD